MFHKDQRCSALLNPLKPPNPYWIFSLLQPSEIASLKQRSLASKNKEYNLNLKIYIHISPFTFSYLTFLNISFYL